MDPILDFFLISVLGIVVLLISTNIVRDDQRVVIFRLGKPLGVRGPGIVMTLPFIDNIKRVNLNETLPGWQLLSKQQLEEKLMALLVHPSGGL